MKLTRLDGQAFHRSAPMSFRAKPRNPSPRLAVAARIPAERRGEMTLPREVKSRPKLLDFPNAPAPISTPA